MIADQIFDRALGCMLGLAVGDALGTTVEFTPRGAFPIVTDITGGGPFRLKPGQWTDDTSMALCLAESLIYNADLDPYDLMDRFRRWLEFGENSSTGKCFDIGKTTLQAISNYRRTREPFSGPSGKFDAGNGSIMRLAPVAIRWWHDREKAIDIARKQSRTTHGSPEAIDSCSLLANILCRAICGEGYESIYCIADSTWADRVQLVSKGSWKNKTESEIFSDGYVINTLEAALWAFEGSSSFEEAVLKAVNLGNDADTVGAVCGQIAGAVWGYSAIPLHWRERLFDRDKIELLVTNLVLANQNENLEDRGKTV